MRQELYDLIFSYIQVVFHCTYVPYFVYPVICSWMTEVLVELLLYLQILAIIKGPTINIKMSFLNRVLDLLGRFQETRVFILMRAIPCFVEKFYIVFQNSDL